jgi:hypothetical protein
LLDPILCHSSSYHSGIERIQDSGLYRLKRILGVPATFDAITQQKLLPVSSRFTGIVSTAAVRGIIDLLWSVCAWVPENPPNEEGNQLMGNGKTKDKEKLVEVGCMCRRRIFAGGYSGCHSISDKLHVIEGSCQHLHAGWGVVFGIGRVKNDKRTYPFINK